MGVTNRASIALGFEQSVGVLPGSPTAVKYPLRGENFGIPLTYDESGEFRDDRLTTAYDLTAEDAAGGFDVNMRCDTFDPLIAAAFYSSWATAPERDNNGVADSNITGVTASTGTYTVASGAAFITQQLLFAEGFTNVENGGSAFGAGVVRELTGGSATTAVVGAGLLIDEAAPPGTARIYVCGFHGASGDITATSTGLGSTALDFTTMTNLVVGGWIKIGGTATLNRFATAALNTWARVTAISANAVTLDNLPAGWTTDAGAGKKIWIFTSELITVADGSTKQTLFLQKKIPVTGGHRYVMAYGLHARLVQINTEARGRMTARFEYQGIKGEMLSSPPVASPVTPRKRRPLVSGRSFVRLHEGGGAFATTISVPSINFVLQNNLVPVPAAHLLGYEDIEPAEAVASFNGNLNFRTDALYTKYRGSTETSMSAVLLQDSQAYVIEGPTGILTTADLQLPGPNQIINMPFTFQAHANEGAITANKQYGWHRFRYVEA